MLRASVGFVDETDSPSEESAPGLGLCGKALEEGRMLYAPCRDCSCSTSCYPGLSARPLLRPHKKGEFLSRSDQCLT